ncbi:hypothetical protein FHX80_115858 [Streptomyces brevispora]|uniref:Uncharacterized protein n=1 Tax=Streptomyces brevispora TaxID=887462 RepID=A0A561V6Y6_9ACTN|nr:hypothetical protein FHX80_115858 [Streptomyces brevispora]
MGRDMGVWPGRTVSGLGRPRYAPRYVSRSRSQISLIVG